MSDSVDDVDQGRDSIVSVDLSARSPSWANPLGFTDLASRKAFECVDIKISITGFDTVVDAGKGSYTAFTLEIEAGLASWTIQRRYTDFYYLNQQISTFIRLESLPLLPKKKFLGSNNEEFLSKRLIGLQTFIRGVVKLNAVWARQAIVNFLDSDAKYLLQLWTIDKMRSGQRTLSFASVTKGGDRSGTLSAVKHENVKLQDEMGEMRDKLARYEMLLVQQVTGASPSNKLSADVIQGLLDMADSTADRLDTVDPDGASVASSPTEAPESLNGNGRTRSRSVSDLPDVEGMDLAGSRSPTAADGGRDTSGSGHSEVGLEEALINRRSMALDSSRVAEAYELAKRGGVDMKDLSEGDWRAKSEGEVEQMSLSLQLQEAIRVSQVLESSLPDSDHVTAPRPVPERGSAPVACVAAPSQSAPELQELRRACGDVDLALAPWATRLQERVDELVTVLLPTQAEVEDRLSVLHYVREAAGTSLGAFVLPVGSFITNTFLPGSDLDVTLCMHWKDVSQWFIRMNEMLCAQSVDPTYHMQLGSSMQRQIHVSNVSFFNGNVKLVKAHVNQLGMDISCNQIGALFSSAVIEKMDGFVGRNHLFKRSLVLLKAWSKFESNRYMEGLGAISGAQDSALPAQALTVMVVWVFNAFGHGIQTPLHALTYFLEHFASFDWENYVVTVYGPAPLASPEQAAWEGPLLLPAHFFSDLRKRLDDYAVDVMQSCELTVDAAYASQSNSSPEVSQHAIFVAQESMREALLALSALGGKCLDRGLLNVMDPLQPSYSFTHRVNDPRQAHMVKHALSAGLQSLVTCCQACKTVPVAPPATEESSEEDKAALHMDVPHVKEFLFNSMDVAMSTIKQRNTWLAAGSHPTPGSGSILNTNSDDIDMAVSVAELMLGSVIETSTLVHVIKLIIENKGPLPVGEIGKHLQDIAGSSLLNKAIKAEYGGLKKVIELSGDIFKLGDEHPFNPTVNLLASTSSAMGMGRGNGSASPSRIPLMPPRQSSFKGEVNSGGSKKDSANGGGASYFNGGSSQPSGMFFSGAAGGAPQHMAWQQAPMSMPGMLGGPAVGVGGVPMPMYSGQDMQQQQQQQHHHHHHHQQQQQQQQQKR